MSSVTASAKLVRTWAVLNKISALSCWIFSASLCELKLRAAETSGDTIAKADAYELLAHIDAELRADRGSAQIALESASQADPSRVDLLHRLEREYGR